MTTKREFIEYLETLPEETEIQVLEMYDGGYGGDYAVWSTLKLGVNTDLIDLRDNKYAQSTSRADKVYLELGEN